MILVTGATGRVGYRVLEALADARAEAIAMVRVEAKGLDLPGRGKNLVATFDEPPAAEQLQDFDRVFLLSPSSETQAELEIVFIDALVAAGHRPHVVKVAADGFLDPGCDVRFMRSHREIARHLDATGLPASYLAPAPFMEMLLTAAPAIRREATLYAPAGHGRVGFVAAADVADAAAQLLTGPVPADGHEPGVFTLTGPDSLSYPKVAARISAVFARQVRYSDLPEERAREELLGSGLAPWEAEGTLELFAWIRAGCAGQLTRDVREVTRHAPRGLDDWLEGARATFLEPLLDGPAPTY
ncbi:MAG: NmrA family NAD(P)-binding protein [Streptosporangiaceae bacterium]